MTFDPIRLVHPTRADRLAVVSVQPAPQGKQHIQVAKGAKRTALIDVKLLGPFLPDELSAAWQGIKNALHAEGYLEGGAAEAALALADPDAGKRARAALKLGWRRGAGACELLLPRVEKPVPEVASVVQALGLLGDGRAVPALRVEADKKLLSRRRAAVEALRQLRDVEGLAQNRARAWARLPEAVAAFLTAGEDLATTTRTQGLVDVVLAVEAKDRGLCIDTLYELGTPLPVAAVRALLSSTPPPGFLLSAPHQWRYTKSVFKRALLRFDFATFGVVQHAIERAARTQKPQTASLKSGLDGETRPTRVFSRATVDYLRRLAWRTLRTVARYRPEHYAVAAAHVAGAYTDADDVVAKGTAPTGRSYVFHRIVLGGSARFVLDDRKLRFRTKSAKPPAPGTREEAFPALWDATPQAFVVLLGRSRHALAQRFSLDGLRRFPDAIAAAPADDVAALLQSDLPEIVAVGLAELQRRFDPRAPDLSVLRAVAASNHEAARAMALSMVRDSAAVWAHDEATTLQLLQLADPALREAAAQALSAQVPSLPVALRRALAQQIVAWVQRPEPEPGAFSGFSAAARGGLLVDVVACFEGADGLKRALALVDSGSDAGLSVGAAVLGERPEALAALGLRTVLAYALHEKAAVRRMALSLLQGASSSFAADPAPLFQLVETDWDDVRAWAIAALDGIDLAHLGIDGLFGLCDSTRADVQQAARRAIERALPHLDVHEVLARVGQHPAPAMQAWAVELCEQHLKPGFVRLAKLEPLFRAVLLSTKPQRGLKRRVIAFLSARGTADEHQAGIAAALLDDFVRTRTVDDRERALAALVEIALRFPGASQTVTLAVAP